MTDAPRLIRYSNPVTRRLLGIGLPMGPNVLLTVRGRVSGQPRSLPVAIAEIDGRRWIIGAYGDVQWVRNLRVAGQGEVQLHGRNQRVRAHELDHTEALRFYGETLPSYVSRLPWFGRTFARLLFRLAGPEVLDDPEKAALTKPVFELTVEPAQVAQVSATR
ncbi:MAG TPA: nitroreductase/quinone reductase family protein [Candidatus Limnocylindrales bacterium]|nr:nitroreductase/quinone reductase family protein [Candidatus Limnocylindrales bacterium]